jgi:hypothetical protein
VLSPSGLISAMAKIIATPQRALPDEFHNASVIVRAEKALAALQLTAAQSRESLLRHVSKQDCASCHQQFLPMAAVGHASSASGRSPASTVPSEWARSGTVAATDWNSSTATSSGLVVRRCCSSASGEAERYSRSAPISGSGAPSCIVHYLHEYQANILHVAHEHAHSGVESPGQMVYREILC